MGLLRCCKQVFGNSFKEPQSKMGTKIKLSSRLFIEHAKEIEEILQRAVNHALLMHKRLGNPIATWKDGKVVIIPPEEIVVPSDFSETESEALQYRER